MKNILIVETCRDNTEIGLNWFDDVNRIPDSNMRKALIDAINGSESSVGDIETYDSMIFSRTGYYFSNLPPTYPPYQVDYVIQHVIE